MTVVVFSRFMQILCAKNSNFQCYLGSHENRPRQLRNPNLPAVIAAPLTIQSVETFLVPRLLQGATRD